MKLHLGCGKRNFGPDWIHIDGSNYDHIYSHDIEKLPFEDNSVDLIYSSHTLEYFDRTEVLNVLKEWSRVLKSGGTLRLAVPDFEAMVKLYVNDDVQLNKFVGPLYGKWEIRPEKFVYHKTTYDFSELKQILEMCNFRDVKKWDWRKTDHYQFDDYSQAYIPHMDKENGTLISLNVEALK